MITRTLLREWGACWFDDDVELDGDARISEVAPGRSSMSPREITQIDDVSLDDRLWVACRSLHHRSEDLAWAFSIDEAAAVSHLAGCPDDQATHRRLVDRIRQIWSRSDPDDADADLARVSIDVKRRIDRSDMARWSNFAWRSCLFASKPSGATWITARSAALSVAASREEDMPYEARITAIDAELRRAIERALVALGEDADGWSDHADPVTGR